MDKPDIMYLAAMRFPSERAHSAQVAMTSAAFATLGQKVEIVIPSRRGAVKGDPFEYFKIPKNENLTVTTLKVPDTIRFGRFGFWFHHVCFALRARAHARIRNPHVLYSRDESVLFFFRNFGIPFVWESHLGKWNILAHSVAEKCKTLIVISRGLQNFYRDRGISLAKITVAPDGVSLESFETTESKETARGRLGLPIDGVIVMYIGSLEKWKGYDTFARAAKFSTARFVVIGGKDHEVERLRKEFPSVLFLGARPYAELPGNQRAADVLVIPNTAKDIVSLQFTSPLKLFTSLASHVPIVASDIPSIREIANAGEVFYVRPDDPEALAKGVNEALHPLEGKKRADAAYQKSRSFSWEARGRTILEAVGLLPEHAIASNQP